MAVELYFSASCSDMLYRKTRDLRLRHWWLDMIRPQLPVVQCRSVHMWRSVLLSSLFSSYRNLLTRYHKITKLLYFSYETLLVER